MRPSISYRLRGAGLWVVDDHLLMESTVGHDRWGVVGGGVEAGELAYQACEREFREELGADVRCERLAIVGDIIIRPNDRLEQDVCFYFVVTSVRETSGVPSVVGQEPDLEFAWIPLAGLGKVELVPPSLDILIPRALTSNGTLFASYDCRENPDERAGTKIWP